MSAKVEDVAAKVGESVAKVESKVDALSQARDEMDRKLLAELAELKALLDKQAP